MTTSPVRPSSPARAASPQKAPVSDAPASPSKAASTPAEGDQQQPKRAKPERNPEEEARKVFVGNLSYKATVESVRTYFSPAGEIESVIIPPHRFRPKGFCFILFKSGESVARAIEQFNESAFDERQISVQAVTEREARPRPVRRHNPRHRRTTNDEGGEAAVNGEEHQEGHAQRRNRRLRGRKPRQNGETTEGDDATQGAHSDANEKPKRQRKPKKANVGASEQSGGEEGDKPATRSHKKARAPRPKMDLSNGVPSTTTIFVGNLSFKTNDESLAEFFKNANYVIKSAKVARMYQGRSRGFGFVEFENEDDQVRALAELNNAELDGRTISLRAAVSPAPNAENDANPNHEQLGQTE